jgi:hypothetical protein
MSGNDIVPYDPQAAAERPDPEWEEVDQYEAELRQTTHTPEQLREWALVAIGRADQAEGRAQADRHKSLSWRWLEGKCFDRLRGLLRRKYLRTIKDLGIDRSRAQRSVSLSQRYTWAEIRRLEAEGKSLVGLLDYSQARRADTDDTSPHLRGKPRKGHGRGKPSGDKERWDSLLHHQATGSDGVIRFSLSRTGGRSVRLALSGEQTTSVQASLAAAQKEAGATGEAVEEPVPVAAENQPEANGKEVTRCEVDRTADGVTVTFFGRGRKPVRDPVPLCESLGVALVIELSRKLGVTAAAGLPEAEG